MKILTIGVACLVIAMLVPATAWGASNQGHLEGHLLDEEGHGIGGATVSVTDLHRVTITEVTGRYTFQDLPPGHYRLVFQLGEQFFEEPDIEIRESATTTHETTVSWQLHFAETLTVRAASRQIERIVETPAAVASLTPEEIERQSAHAQLPRLLAVAPGAEVTQNGLYDFSVNARGFNAHTNRRILTLIDGRDPSVPVLLGVQQWAAISFPLDDLESVELVRGPSAALYGAGAFNGVLNLVTKPPRDSLGGQLRLTVGELETRRAELRIADDLGQGWFVKAMGTYFEGDGFATSRASGVEYAPGVLPGEVVPLPTERSEIASGSVRLDKVSTSGRSLTLAAGTAAISDFLSVTSSGRSFATSEDRPWARVRYAAPRWSVQGHYTGRRTDELIALGAGSSSFLDSLHAGLELQTNLNFSDAKGRVVAGASYAYQDVDSADPMGTQTILSAPQEVDRKSVFGQVDYEISERLRLFASLRWDDSDLHAAELSPRFAVTYAASAGNVFRFNYSNGFKSPSIVEFFLETPIAPPLDLSALEGALAPLLGGVPLHFESIPLLITGNQNVDIEQIETFEIGYRGIFGRRVFLDVSVYASEIEDFVGAASTSFPGANFSFPPYMPPAELSPTASAVVLGTLAAALPPELLSAMSVNSQGDPVFVVFSLANFGSAETSGLELSLGYAVADGWMLDFSYTYFDFSTTGNLPAEAALPNTPEHRLGFALTHTRDDFDASLRYRWVDSFDWASGILVGPVPSYEVVDVALNYDFSQRLGIGAEIANLLDDRHWESFGGDVLRRRGIAYAKIRW